MLTEAATYHELYRNFRWIFPRASNLATACWRPPRRRKRPAGAIYVDEDGGTTRTSFDEVADMSRRFANVLKADGLRAAIASQFFVAIPRIADRASGGISLRHDLDPAVCAVWRGRAGIPPGESEARAIITDEAGWEKLTKIRDRLPYLQESISTSNAVHAPAPNRSGRSIETDVPRNNTTVDTYGRRSRPDHLHLGHDG